MATATVTDPGVPNEPTMEEILADFPPGPLDIYRKKASFDWKKMKHYLEGEDMIKFKHRIAKTLATDGLFSKPLHTLPLEENREVTFKRVKRLREYNFLDAKERMSSSGVLKDRAMTDVIYSFDPSLNTRYALNFGMFGGTVKSSGSERHDELVEQCNNFEEYVINTPDIEATKIWIGNLGKTATHAVTYAQLYTPDGQCHGLHSFVTPIRDPKTMLALPGVIVGDMGEKIGLNGIDNGFVSFHNFRIPREYLLNKTGDVTVDGRYVTPFKDPNKRFGASLGALSGGRVGITGMAVTNMKLALPIAVRYSGVRRQFGPQGKEEIPVIEYQLQQWRLIPYLAATYALEHFSKTFFLDYVALRAGMMFGDKSERQAELGREIHAVSCSSKPLAGWTARDAIQECREACGGHGYFKVNRLGNIRDDNDPNMTYEGDNNVILQQTSNYILGQMYTKKKGGEISSPLESLGFLNDIDNILKTTFNTKPGQTVNAQDALSAFKWLVSYLVTESESKLQQELNSGKDGFTARNDSQAYLCRSLSLAYIQHLVLQRFYDYVHDPEVPPDLRPVLIKLCDVYGLWSIEKSMADLYQGGYFQGREPAKMIRDRIVSLCNQLKDDAISLVDVIAPPDFILNSPIGHSNGQIYKNLYGAMMQGPKVLERPSWWKEFLDKPVIGSLRHQSKL